ncbi:MAG: hypothetical protein E7262_03645 [Lachnospiraceae bacterium]|nr:hypothetical protein [Lachnospiraceae bacterium]
MEVESVAQIIGIINIVCIGIIVCANVILVIETKCKRINNSASLCIKNNDNLLVWVIIKCIKESTIKKLKAYKTIRRLNVCEDSVVYTRAYYVKKYSLVVWIFLLMNIVSLGVIWGFKDKVNNRSINFIKDISKPLYGQNSIYKELDIDIIDEEGHIEKSTINIEIEPNRLSIFDEVKLINQAREEIERKVLKDNSNFNRVEESLNLISKVECDSNISIMWNTDAQGIIDFNGNIDYAYLEKQGNPGIKVQITAIIKYFDNKYEHPIELTLYKKEEDEHTKVINAIQREISKNNKSYSLNGILMLPEEIGNYTIRYKEKEKNELERYLLCIVMLGCACIFVVIKYKDKDFNKDIKAKEEQLIESYGEIVSKMKMLVIAGMTVEAALKKISIDYVKDKEKKNIYNYAYEEMLYTYKDIEVGTSSIEAFKEMGKRIGISPYIRLSSIIIQNIRNGTDNFIDALELEVKSVESKQTEHYIKKGGELGAKLLLPMMLMMGITLIIVMLPALIIM